MGAPRQLVGPSTSAAAGAVRLKDPDVTARRADISHLGERGETAEKPERGAQVAASCAGKHLRQFLAGGHAAERPTLRARG